VKEDFHRIVSIKYQKDIAAFLENTIVFPKNAVFFFRNYALFFEAILQKSLEMIFYMQSINIQYITSVYVRKYRNLG